MMIGLLYQFTTQSVTYNPFGTYHKVMHSSLQANDGEVANRVSPGVRKVVHVSACNVVGTRKPVFTSRSQGSLSGYLFLKPPDRPSQRSETGSVRAPPRFAAARWDSHHLEIPRDTSPYYCLHSALPLSPACYLQPLCDLFAHIPPLTLLPYSAPAYSSSSPAPGDRAIPTTTTSH